MAEPIDVFPEPNSNTFASGLLMAQMRGDLFFGGIWTVKQRLHCLTKVFLSLFIGIEINNRF